MRLGRNHGVGGAVGIGGTDVCNRIDEVLARWGA